LRNTARAVNEHCLELKLAGLHCENNIRQDATAGPVPMRL
jgi:hypothetical protein